MVDQLIYSGAEISFMNESGKGLVANLILGESELIDKVNRVRGDRNKIYSWTKLEVKFTPSSKIRSANDLMHQFLDQKVLGISIYLSSLTDISTQSVSFNDHTKLIYSLDFRSKGLNEITNLSNFSNLIFIKFIDVIFDKDVSGITGIPFVIDFKDKTKGSIYIPEVMDEDELDIFIKYVMERCMYRGFNRSLPLLNFDFTKVDELNDLVNKIAKSLMSNSASIRVPHMLLNPNNRVSNLIEMYSEVRVYDINRKEL
jgi:hypothetical protein